MLGFSGHHYNIPYAGVNFGAGYVSVSNQMATRCLRMMRRINNIMQDKEAAQYTAEDQSCSKIYLNYFGPEETAPNP